MMQTTIPIHPPRAGFFSSKTYKESTMIDTNKTKAVRAATQTASQNQLNPHDTSINNQQAICLRAFAICPQSTIDLRHTYGVMMPAARVKELRNMGYDIATVRVTETTPDNISHKGVAKYVLRGVSHE